MKKVIFVMLVLLGLSNLAFASIYQGEDSGLIEATILDFGRDDSDNALIFLRVNNILEYFHNQSSVYEPLQTNQSITLGFMWGHKTAKPSNITIEKGDRIQARIGYHYNFTSHTGHLYEYEQICSQDEIKIDGDCYPAECAADEHFVNKECVKLECEDYEEIVNHRCVVLDCASDEVGKGHDCTKLECEDDEYAINHACKKLECEEDEKIINHDCEKLSCYFFQKVGVHKCVLNWGLIGGVALLLVVLGYFWYEDIDKKIRKTSLYKKFVSNDFYILPFIVIIGIVILLIPLLIRITAHSPLIIGEESYLQIKIAQSVFDNFPDGFFAQRYGLYHVVVAGVGILIGIDYAAVIVPLILGAFSLLCIANILQRSKLDLILKSTLLTMVAISPGFIYLFTFSTPDSLAIFLMLLGSNLLIRNKRGFMLAGGILFLAAALNSLFIMVLCCAILLLIMTKKKRNKGLMLSIIFVILLISAPFNFINFSQRDTLYQFIPNLLKDSIVSFGALNGFSVFSLFLALFGFVVTWRQKRKYALFYALFMGMVLFGLALNKNYNMYWNFIIVYFAGLGFVRLIKAKWELKLVKELSILLIVCGLIFSTVLYTKQLATMQPGNEIIEGLEWLREQEQGLVLSHYSRGYWIEYFAEKQAFVDQSYGPGTDQLLNVSDEIFYSRDLIKTDELLTDYNITYIFIDREMRDGLVWVKEDQGLLFLFRNNKTFKRIHTTPHTEVWMHIFE